MTKTMTEREFLTAVSMIEDEVLHNEAIARLEAIDLKNEKRKGKTTPRQAENAELREKIFQAIGEGTTAKAMGEMFGITTQRASALLTQLEKDGRLDYDTARIDGHKCKFYKITE